MPESRSDNIFIKVLSTSSGVTVLLVAVSCNLNNISLTLPEITIGAKFLRNYMIREDARNSEY